MPRRKQIKRRLDVLETVKGLLWHPTTTIHTPVEKRFDEAVANVVKQAIREAQGALRSASVDAEEAGKAPVEQQVIDFVKSFNCIGPARLKRLHRSRRERSGAAL
ncbi:hypothetical protein [Bradyrhizobium sp. 162]|uniref:hypothetical protein n=1 Tax=Bradyrhizobium sp. 162 TaxID=2782635 RepID=UPI001FF82332|nr:hypothetical protein [Bradyrhizobium sp. 162]MCK1631488.1 hypothetical protein [Bradyrhizobium sp. 162]